MKKQLLLILSLSASLVSFAQKAKDENLIKNSVPDATITFVKSKERPAVIYTTGTTVYEEALDNGQMVGLYWKTKQIIQILPTKQF